MNNPSESASTRTPGGLAARLYRFTLPLLVLAVAIVGFASMAILRSQVPLSDADAAAITVFGFGFQFSASVIIAFGVISLIVSVAPVLKGLSWATAGLWIVGFALLSSLNSNFAFNTLKRIAVLDGNGRVGCFIDDSRECYELLGVSDDFPDAPNQGYGDTLHPWAAQKLKGNPEVPTRYLIPGSLLVMAPFYLSRSQELSEKLAAQRKELEMYRAELAQRAARSPRYVAELRSDMPFVPAKPHMAVPARFSIAPRAATGKLEGVNAQARVMLGTLKNCEALGDAFSEPSHNRVYVSLKTLQCESTVAGEPKKQAPLLGYLRDPRKANPAELFPYSGTPGLVGAPAVAENPQRHGLKLAAGDKGSLVLE